MGVVIKGQQRGPCGDGNVLYLYHINVNIFVAILYYSFTRCYQWQKPQTSLYYFLTARESMIILNKKLNLIKQCFNSPVLNHYLLAVSLCLFITFISQMGVDGDLEYRGSGKNDEKWAVSRCILKVEPKGFADGSNM